MLDVPGDGPFIQKPILKNRYKFDHVARRSTVWRYVAACWVSRAGAAGVGWRPANQPALSPLNRPIGRFQPLAIGRGELG